MSKYITTLNAIREHRPCKDGWEKLLKYLGKTKADDEPLDLLTILDSNGLDDALWCLRALPEEYHSMAHSLACDFAAHVLHIVPPEEPRPDAAIASKRAWLKGKLTDAELAAARADAVDAAWSAKDAARDAAWAAAEAAVGDECTAWSSALDVADAALDAVLDVEWHAEREWQEQHFRKVLTEEAVR